MKVHISELNLHAEAQAMEYKQKVILVIASNKMSWTSYWIYYNLKLSSTIGNCIYRFIM